MLRARGKLFCDLFCLTNRYIEEDASAFRKTPKKKLKGKKVYTKTSLNPMNPPHAFTLLWKLAKKKKKILLKPKLNWSKKGPLKPACSHLSIWNNPCTVEFSRAWNLLLKIAYEKEIASWNEHDSLFCLSEYDSHFISTTHWTS